MLHNTKVNKQKWAISILPVNNQKFIINSIYNSKTKKMFAGNKLNKGPKELHTEK